MADTSTGVMIPGADASMQMAPIPSAIPTSTLKTKNVVKMAALGMLPDQYGVALETLKTSPIENLPCGNCQNFVTTVCVESKFPITSLPPCAWPSLWIANKRDCWYKRLEHICPNCGVILMVCQKPVVKKLNVKLKCLDMKWHRVLPKEIHDKQRWETFDENWSLIENGDNV